MGIFNLFIVIPQILVALIINRLMENFPQVNRISAVVFGGICMTIAALLTLRLKEHDDARKQRV